MDWKRHRFPNLFAKPMVFANSADSKSLFSNLCGLQVLASTTVDAAVGSSGHRELIYYASSIPHASMASYPSLAMKHAST